MPGAIFLDAHANADFSDRISFLYGHNVKHGTMFAHLEKFKDKAFYEEHPFFYLYTPKKTYHGNIIAMYSTSATDPIYFMKTNNNSSFQSYVHSIQKHTDAAFAIEENATILTLSTCSYEAENARYVLHAILHDMETNAHAVHLLEHTL